jgi:hypothetical protein
VGCGDLRGFNVKVIRHEQHILIKAASSSWSESICDSRNRASFHRHLSVAVFLGAPPLDAIMFHHLVLAAAAIAVASSATTPDTQHNGPNTAKTTKPNFIFIMTDDQDLHMDSLKYMPAVQEHFGNSGTFHKKHYCTVSQCCPSRVSLLTGKAAHNTNVTSVTEPYGTFFACFSQQPCASADSNQSYRRLSQIHIRRVE